jgi:hypothetical protein
MGNISQYGSVSWRLKPQLQLQSPPTLTKTSAYYHLTEPYCNISGMNNKGWGSRVRFIPDGNGDFTRELGMMVNLSDEGMGQRSWQYSMLVKDGAIEKMFVERNGFETMPVVATAETMLKYINPTAEKPDRMMLVA